MNAYVLKQRCNCGAEFEARGEDRSWVVQTMIDWEKAHRCTPGKPWKSI